MVCGSRDVGPTVMDLLRQIAARLEAVETAQRRGRPIEDVSEDEVEEVGEQVPDIEQGDGRFLRAMTRVNAKPHFNPPDYDGKLDSDELLNWISEMEKYFEYESTPVDKKAKITSTKSKGHAFLWWEHLQTDRQSRRKEKIKTWVKMVNKLKGKFLPSDYQVSLLRKLQNLKQRDTSVKKYTEELYRLDIKSGHMDDEVERIVRYLDGLRISIQDEISLVKMDSIEEAYQFTLMAKES